MNKLKKNVDRDVRDFECLNFFEIKRIRWQHLKDKSGFLILWKQIIWNTRFQLVFLPRTRIINVMRMIHEKWKTGGKVIKQDTLNAMPERKLGIIMKITRKNKSLSWRVIFLSKKRMIYGDEYFIRCSLERLTVRGWWLVYAPVESGILNSSCYHGREWIRKYTYTERERESGGYQGERWICIP